MQLIYAWMPAIWTPRNRWRTERQSQAQCRPVLLSTGARRLRFTEQWKDHPARYGDHRPIPPKLTVGEGASKPGNFKICCRAPLIARVYQVPRCEAPSANGHEGTGSRAFNNAYLGISCCSSGSSNWSSRPSLILRVHGTFRHAATSII
ncbi:hypothetical protein DSL92_02880 [Billgrantia gudaonensis]|uniref:Uncharacterized protein n=1 Tax=Billgrantia gudaonensis TaxID=376427 RepID=A0A3S0Q1G7_9GAMM|nr:hypothetical protein DSL92_02880 [Halomonas gudaonensis]